MYLRGQRRKKRGEKGGRAGDGELARLSSVEEIGGAVEETKGSGDLLLSIRDASEVK